MSALRARPAFFVILSLVAMAGVAVPVGIHTVDQRNQRITAEMMTIAKDVQIPVGVVVRDRNDCRGDGGVVACWSSRHEPAELAAAFQHSLSQAAHRPSRLSCQTLIYGLQPQSCLVRFDRSGHAVLISIDSGVNRDRTGALQNAGSVLRIDAS